MEEVPPVDFWMDPRVWLVGAAIMILLTIVLIYYKVFTGEKKP